MSEINMTIIAGAAGFALAAHAGQKRKYNGEDFYNHPKRVSEILFDHGHTDEDVIIAALLHDVVEDTHVTYEQIEAYFGEDVAALVDWVTKTDWKAADGSSLPRREQKRLEADRLALAPARAKTIKLADRLDNTPDIIANDPKFAVVFVAETRHLLDHALVGGCPVLWAKVDAVVREFQQQNA